MAETTTAPAAPTAPVTPAAAPAAPVTPAKTATPPLPAAQAASVSTTPKPNPEIPSAPGFQKTESIESLMRKTAKEAFSKENLDGKELIVTKKEPVKAEVTPEPVKAPEKKAEPAAPAKIEDKPATGADRFSDIAPPDGATEVTQKGWKALKDKANAEIAATEKKYADAQAELETFRKATPAEQADVAKLKADHQAALDRLAVLDLSAHPEFKKQYAEPKQKALAIAETLAKDYAKEGKSIDVAALLNKPRKEFAEAVSEMAKDMPVFDQADFTTNMRDAYRLQGDERTALSKAGELRAQLQAKNAQQQKQAFIESKTEFSSRVPMMQAPENATPEQLKEISDYNTAREAAFAEAERFTFGSATDRQVADIATRAAALDLVAHHVLPKTQRELKQATELISQLTAELSAIKDKKNPGTFSGETPASPRDVSKGTFHDAMEEAKRMAGTR